MLKSTATTELQWLNKKAILVKEFPGECKVRKFEGRLPYRMAMNVISRNDWDKVNDVTNHDWNAQNFKDMNFTYSIYYAGKTGILTFEAIDKIN